jgi:RNA polymerase sigma-70 factor (ECF subfamily)
MMPLSITTDTATTSVPATILSEFEQVVSDVREQIVKNWSRRLGDGAEDVAQDAIIGGYRSLGKYRGDAPMRAWLCRVGRNRGLDACRKSKTILSHQSELDEETLSALPVSGPGPEELAERQEEAALVHRALEQLSPGYRELLTLHYLKGYSYEEICECLGLKLNTLKVRLNRAREACRKQYVRLQTRREGVSAVIPAD